MRKATFVTVIALVFLLGVAVGGFAAKKGGVTPAAWQGASPEEAAANLLEIARGLTDADDSWENIHIGRTYYLSGDQRQAEAIFDRYVSGSKTDSSDVIRVGRVYAQAGDWDKARPLFDRVVELEPKDEDWLVEAGAFYNLHGDRETAEGLFARGFRTAPKNLNNILNAAGSYVGVAPRKR